MPGGTATGRMKMNPPKSFTDLGRADPATDERLARGGWLPPQGRPGGVDGTPVYGSRNETTTCYAAGTGLGRRIVGFRGLCDISRAKPGHPAERARGHGGDLRRRPGRRAGIAHGPSVMHDVRCVYDNPKRFNHGAVFCAARPAGWPGPTPRNPAQRGTAGHPPYRPHLPEERRKRTTILALPVTCPPSLEALHPEGFFVTERTYLVKQNNPK